MVKSHKEMSHILGLLDNPFKSKVSNEGWFAAEACESLRNRYESLKSAGASNLNFSYLPSQNVDDILPASQGKYIGFYSEWKEHGYTLHAINEGDQTHFIYVNRGQRHITEDKSEPPSVIVFSMNTGEEARAFANDMLAVANSVDIQNKRQNMSDFLNGNNNKVNVRLTTLLSKKDQKTGNCSVANSNIAWHFQLASEFMLKNGADFATAYAATQSDYKDMRIKDRIEAFKYLLKDKGNYSSTDAFYYNYYQALIKLSNKKLLLPLIESVRKDKLLIKSLIEPLLNSEAEIKKFFLDINKYIPVQSAVQSNRINIDIKPVVLNEFFKELDLKTQEGYLRRNSELLKYAEPTLQKKFIEQDIVLLKFASKEVQRELLILDKEKYRYYASDEAMIAVADMANDQGFWQKGRNILVLTI